MLRKIKFPTGYGRQDRAYCLALIERGHAQTLPYDGAWIADWLLNDLHSDVWFLRTNETRFFNGHWHGAKRINWDVPIANGTNLTDDDNRKIREAAQKAAFLVRFLPNNGLDSISTHSYWIYTLNTFIQWLYLHEELYQPSYRQFSLVDEDAITDFIQEFARGGPHGLFSILSAASAFFTDVLSVVNPIPIYLAMFFMFPKPTSPVSLNG